MAHEGKVVEGHHVYSRKTGYQEVPYEPQEYPKQVKRYDGVEVVVYDAEQEAAATHAPADAAPVEEAPPEVS